MLLKKLWELIRVYRGREFPSEKTPRAMAAVVLGAEVLPGGRPSRTLRVRALFAARLHSEGAVGVLVPSGGVGKHPPSEAAVISEVLRNAEVPAEDILLEERGRNTQEQARLVTELARSSGIESILVVTDPLHCIRAVSMFKEAGLPAEAAPVYESPMWRSVGLRRKQFLREVGATVWYAIKSRFRR